jgi:hypothetical protein
VIEYSARIPHRGRSTDYRVRPGQIPAPKLAAIQRELAKPGGPAPWVTRTLNDPRFRAQIERELESHGVRVAAHQARSEGRSERTRAATDWALKLKAARVDVAAQRLRARLAAIR